MCVARVLLVVRVLRVVHVLARHTRACRSISVQVQAREKKGMALASAACGCAALTAFAPAPRFDASDFSNFLLSYHRELSHTVTATMCTDVALAKDLAVVCVVLQ